MDDNDPPACGPNSKVASFDRWLSLSEMIHVGSSQADSLSLWWLVVAVTSGLYSRSISVVALSPSLQAVTGRMQNSPAVSAGPFTHDR